MGWGRRQEIGEGFAAVPDGCYREADLANVFQCYGLVYGAVIDELDVSVMNIDYFDLT